MSMKNMLLAGVAGTLLAASAMAAEPMKLTDSQLDNITAGATTVAGEAYVSPIEAYGHQYLKIKAKAKVRTKQSNSSSILGSSSRYEAKAYASLKATQTSDQPGGAYFYVGGVYANAGSTPAM